MTTRMAFRIEEIPTPPDVAELLRENPAASCQQIADFITERLADLVDDDAPGKAQKVRDLYVFRSHLEARDEAREFAEDEIWSATAYLTTKHPWHATHYQSSAGERLERYDPVMAFRHYGHQLLTCIDEGKVPEVDCGRETFAVAFGAFVDAFIPEQERMAYHIPVMANRKDFRRVIAAITQWAEMHELPNYPIKLYHFDDGAPPTELKF